MVLDLTTEADGSLGEKPIEAPPARQAGWWAGKAFWAVLDQGLFATSNFALGILLARWLTPEQFGSFAVAQSIFLLVGTLHTGLFTEPMLVFASARHATRFSAYLDILLHAHWRLTGLASVILACAALVFWTFGSLPLAGAFLGAALASPFILFAWLVRRACVSRLQPQWAAMGGALYLVLLLAASYLVWLVHLLSAFSALVLLGGASLISAQWILGRLRAGNLSSVGAELSRGEVLRDHWDYGQWSLASSALSWIPGNLYYILIPAFGGVEAAGALKAVFNLVMPILHFNGALATLLLPSLASAARRKSHFNRLLAASFMVFAGGSLLYWGFLTAFRVQIVAWLYHGAYSDAAGLVPILALLPLSAACSAVLGSALRALERPQQVFWAYVASTCATITVGIWGVVTWGLTGAAIGLVVSSAITAAACGAFLMGYVPKSMRGEGRGTSSWRLGRRVVSFDDQP